MFSSSSASLALWLIPLLPFAGFVVNGLFSLVPAWRGERVESTPSGRRGLVSLVGVGVLLLAFALSIALALTGGTYATAPECSSEAVQTEAGDRYVAYHCVVAPLASGRWSGRSTVVPSGWALGTGADARQVCRYATDLDGSGAIDSNEEHPATYSAVDHSLANQNFLVIAGNQTCPAGAASDAFVSHATAAHQP